jgi:hypothetical protein
MTPRAPALLKIGHIRVKPTLLALAARIIRELLTGPILPYGLTADVQCTGNLANRSSLSLPGFDLGIKDIASRTTGLLLGLVLGATAALTVIDRHGRYQCLRGCRQKPSLKVRSETVQRTFQSFAEIHKQMPAVSHLTSRWSALGCATAVLGRTVARNPFDAGMGLQPSAEGLSRAFLDQIDWTVCFALNQQRPIDTASTPGKIIHPQHPWPGSRRPLIAPKTA